MADPLSALGTAVGVASLGIQVTQSLLEYYRAYRDCSSEVAGTSGRLESLQTVFQHLQDALSSHTFGEKEQSLVKSAETSITNCRGMILSLQGRYEKFKETKDASPAFKDSFKLKVRQGAYPFKKPTLLKLDEDISKIQDSLSFALDVFQLNDAQKIREDVAEIQANLDSMRVQEIPRRLTDWLKAPDPTIDHNAAQSKVFQNTGRWLVESSAFLTWLKEENSMIWVKGLPGSGKSILCSTAIEAVRQQRRGDSQIGVAFFYFTFSDSAKQDVSSMIQPLLLQLSSQLQDGHANLVQLYESYSFGTPPSTALLECLRNMILKFRHVYILVDALDESPRSGSREESGSRRESGSREDVLDAVETLRKWGVQGLHLFVTSRDECDIRDCLDLSTTRQITLQNKEVADDIANFIDGRLQDRRFKKLSPWSDKIREALTKGAKGIFRWVECQLQSLRSCPCSEYHLNTTLNSLPPTLDKTYERILHNIPEPLFADARRILTLLCFSLRPLTIEELIDGVAIVVSGSPGLDPTRRMQDFDDIQGICPGLVDFGHRWDRFSKSLSKTVRIAHSSIQEYLENERIQDQKASKFSLNPTAANTEIAQICLTYLLEDGLCISKLDWPIVQSFPLARYAARYWHEHCRAMVEHAPEVDSLSMKLFQRETAFITWVRLYDANLNRWLQFELSLDRIATPIYYASLLGLDRTLSELITAETSKSESTSASSIVPAPIVSTQSEKLVSPPNRERQGVPFGEDDYKMHTWFRTDASRNFKIGYYNTALVAASAQGHVGAVTLLLDRGAKSNREGRRYGRALSAAVLENQSPVVQLLLARGADIHVEAGRVPRPLHLASFRGFDQIVRMLLETGADVNARSGRFGNALQAASTQGHYQIVQMLLERGADINAPSKRFPSALQAASATGHEQIVSLLLEQGADVNAKGGVFGTALQEASLAGHCQIVQQLLERQADVNAQGGKFQNALQAASSRGLSQVVRILLEEGADVNIQGGHFQNALQAASSGGHSQVVSLLLDWGADVNAQGGLFYDNALQAAQSRRHDRAVEILRHWGAIERVKALEPWKENATNDCRPSSVQMTRRSRSKGHRSRRSSPSTYSTADPIDYWECSGFRDVLADLKIEPAE